MDQAIYTLINLKAKFPRTINSIMLILCGYLIVIFVHDHDRSNYLINKSHLHNLVNIIR